MTICKYTSCGKQPIYGLPGEKAEYCVKHKKDDMIDVKHKTCLKKYCEIRASYGLPGEKAKYCKEHKKDGMINVVSKRCIEQGCETRPSYGLPGQKKEYCKKHKKDCMIDVVSKRCLKTGCETQPTYGLLGEKAKYCKDHKKDGMINVVSKRCLKTGCETHPTYGLPGKNAQYCKTHRKKDMINVKDKRCIEQGCETQPTYGFPGGKKEYCKEHKKDGMIDVNNKICKNDHCETRANPRYKGYCAYCFKNLFPNDPLSKNHKTKEKEVVNFIKQEFEEQHDITTDKTVGGCSKRRPDILIELYLKKHNIIVEIDECAHRSYDTTCENKRTCELYQDLAYKKLVIIRFNPDSYDNEEGKRVKSPWTFSRTGVLSISNKKEWSGRLDALKEKISHWIETKPTKAITIDYLFFNADKTNLK
jgi:EsV-1-7 cysteine-rich motif